MLVYRKNTRFSFFCQFNGAFRRIFSGKDFLTWVLLDCRPVVFVYRCVMERQTCPEIGWYQSFGLAVYCTRPGSQVLLTALFDISLDRAFVERLAEDCTRFQLDPVHLMDVAEDALA